MRGAADPDDEEAEADRRPARRRGKSKACVARGATAGSDADRERDEAEGQVDGEQPGPAPGRGWRRRCVGPRVKAVATTNALWPRPRPCRRLGIHEPHQRDIHGHDAAGAQPLQRACDQQGWQRPGQRAAQ